MVEKEKHPMTGEGHSAWGVDGDLSSVKLSNLVTDALLKVSNIGLRRKVSVLPIFLSKYCSCIKFLNHTRQI